MDSGRIDDHRDRWATPLENLKNIADGSAGRGGDHANLSWPVRQALLALLGKQAFCLQLGLEGVKSGLERAFPGGLHVFHHNLEVAARDIQGDLGPYQHLLAILRLEIQQPVTVSKHGPVNLGAGILEAEVPVTRGRPGEVGQFSLQPDQRKGAFQQSLGFQVQLADGKGVGAR